MAKYPHWTGQLENASDQIAIVGGRLEALVNNLGSLGEVEVADGLLSGVLERKEEGGRLIIQLAKRLLFDRHARRRIPSGGFVSVVRDPNREYHLVRPASDYAKCLGRFEDTGFDPGVAVKDFGQLVDELYARLRAVLLEEEYNNLCKGVCLPVVVPQTEIVDLGRTTEEFVAVAGKSYCRQFPKRSFKNCRQGELKSQTAIVDGSRYERLVEGIAKSSVVGIYFPNPLQGFSVDAQREQMATLPEGFVLSGPLDTAMGWVMYPDVLGRDYKTPLYGCSAVQWRSSEDSLSFWADDDWAYFDRRAYLSSAPARYSGGLLFIG